MHVSRSRSDPRLAQGGSVGVEKTRLWFAARAGKKELEGLAQIQKVCPDPASRDDGVLPRRAPEASHKTLRLPLPPRLPFFLELSAAEYRPPEIGKNTVYVDKSSSDNCRKKREIKAITSTSLLCSKSEPIQEKDLSCFHHWCRQHNTPKQQCMYFSMPDRETKATLPERLIQSRTNLPKQHFLSNLPSIS